MTIFGDNFPTIFSIILKISVRFALKQLRCEFWSSYIISDSEEAGTLVLQIAIIFGMKKKRMRVKENIEYQNFFTNNKIKDHSTIQQEIKLEHREAF